MITEILVKMQKNMSDKEKQILYSLVMSNPKLKKKILKEEKHMTITEKERSENEKN